MDPLPFSLRQLQYLQAVAETKSFRGAAELCHVAQPSLSAQVATVEEALGVQVFERGRGGVRLTAAGEVVLARARAVLLGAADLVEGAKGLRDPLACTLRLGVIPTIAPYLLPAAAAALRRSFPRMTLLWREDRTPKLVRDLHAGLLDGALVALEAELGVVERVEIARDEFVLAVARGHALSKGTGPVRSAALSGESMLLLEDGHCFRDQALSFCDRVGAEEGAFRATSLPTLVQMVAGGAGATLLPSLAAKVENRNRSLVIRAIAPRPPFRTIGLIWRKGAALDPALRAVGEALRTPRSP